MVGIHEDWVKQGEDASDKNPSFTPPEFCPNCKSSNRIAQAIVQLRITLDNHDHAAINSEFKREHIRTRGTVKSRQPRYFLVTMYYNTKHIVEGTRSRFFRLLTPCIAECPLYIDEESFVV